MAYMDANAVFADGIQELSFNEIDSVGGGQTTNQVCQISSGAGIALGAVGVVVAVVTAGSAVALAAGVGLAMGGLFATSAGAATCNWRSENVQKK